MTPGAIARILSSEPKDVSLTQRPRFGHVVSVSGSQAVAALDASYQGEAKDIKRIEIGTLVKIPTPVSSVVGIVSAMSAPMPVSSGSETEIQLVELNLAGEIFVDPKTGAAYFRRGVSTS